MTRTESYLLRLGKKIVRIPIQHHLADHLQRHYLLRNELRRIQHVELKAIRELFVKDLKAQLKLRKISRSDGIPQIAAMEIGIRSIDLNGLIPQQRAGAKFRPPVKLHKLAFPGCVDQPESVNSEALHHSERSRYGPVRHNPHNHVHRFRHQRDEIPKRIVCRSSLRKSAIQIG